MPWQDLRLLQGPFHGASEQAAYAALMADVLGLSRPKEADPTWRPFAFFDTEGRCVANVEAAIFTLVVENIGRAVAAIGAVAVAPPWRGRGLFRALMDDALAWCDRRSAGLTFLYAAEPALYGRFGFHPVAQHAFVGPAPSREPAAPARRLDIFDLQDRALITHHLAKRKPVSHQAALCVPPSVVLANLAKDELAIAFAEESGTTIVFEEDDEALILADVATSSRVPSSGPGLATLLGALGRAPRHVKTLFPPDRLGWQGEPVEEDAGLMVRGVLPAALNRPFMFPPTAEF